MSTTGQLKQSEKCEKVRCRSRYEAMKLLAKVTRKGLGPQRIYRCPKCGGWHLTSRVRPWWRATA